MFRIKNSPKRVIHYHAIFPPSQSVSGAEDVDGVNVNLIWLGIAELENGVCLSTHNLAATFVTIKIPRKRKIQFRDKIMLQPNYSMLSIKRDSCIYKKAIASDEWSNRKFYCLIPKLYRAGQAGYDDPPKTRRRIVCVNDAQICPHFFGNSIPLRSRNPNSIGWSSQFRDINWKGKPIVAKHDDDIGAAPRKRRGKPLTRAFQ